MVTMIGVLKEFHDLPLTDYELAELAYTIERYDLGIQGGHPGSVRRHFRRFQLHRVPGRRGDRQPAARPPRHHQRARAQHAALLHRRHPALDRIIEDQTRRFEERNEETTDGLRMQKELAVEMKSALLRGRLDDFGDLLHQAWEQKKHLSPRISNEHLAEAYATARAKGAIGGKVTGAGGGGYMLLYCRFDRKHRVAEA
jgi:D-glycero-alpha-D-manno-heptose-7-phosphate kinase